MLRALALASAAFLSSALCAQGKPEPPVRIVAPELKYETYTLPNGLKVITHEDHRLPLVAVDLWYHVGPLNDRPGRTGFAHLFEHMMFEGSEHVGEKAHIRYLENAGASDVNGTTSFDRTNYFETVPSNQLDLALWLESDRMGFLMEGLNRTLLANQRDVVRNERRQGEGQPYNAAREAEYHLLFPKGHPYYGDVIGSHSDIEAARIADIRDFHQQFYTPNNASIAIAGDFDPRKLRAMLEKYFGPIPKGPQAPPVQVTTPPITSQRRATVTDTVQLSQVRIAWLTPGLYSPASYSVDAAVYALGYGKQSRLSQELVFKREVAQSVSCDDDFNKLAGVVTCVVTAKPGVKLEDLEAAVWKEVGNLQAEGPTAQEVAANKAVTLTAKITGLQRLGGFGGVADTLDQYNQYTGDPGFLSKDFAMTEAVTAASTQAAARQYFTKDSAVVVYTTPGKKVLDDVPRSPDSTDADVLLTNPNSPAFETAQNWRKTAPAPGPPVTPHLPAPQSFKLANGLTVLLVEDHSLPLFTAELVVRAGSDSNPPGKAGLAGMTADLMRDGTTSRSLLAMAEQQQRLGTLITTSTTVDNTTVNMTALTAFTAPAMDLFADEAQHPAFRTEDVERRRKLNLIGIQQESDNVMQIAFRVGPKLLFGDQPYGQSSRGTTESVQKLTQQDIEAFYKEHFGPADSALVLTGDLSAAEARRLAETALGSWSGAAQPVVSLPPPPPQKPTHVVIVDKPGAPQTALLAFALGVPANSPDEVAVDLANYTLGSAFASRINMNLREVHGYTYGAFSEFPAYRFGGEFISGALVRTDVTAPAAKELIQELRNFGVNPSTPAELAAARSALVQSLPGSFETTSGTARAMASLFTYGRPLDYYVTLPARYGAVSAAEIAGVATRDLHSGDLVLVAAGDRAKIEPALKAAGLGPVEVSDVNGVIVSAVSGGPSTFSVNQQPQP